MLNKRMKKNRRFLRGVFNEIRQNIAVADSTANPPSSMPQKRFKTVFISDLHIGMPSSRAKEQLEFINDLHADHIYLVGDVVDLWCNLKRTWKPVHTEILQAIIQKAKNGTKITYIPGNHDPLFRGANRAILKNFEIVDNCFFMHSDKNYLVTHGDEADFVSHKLPFIAFTAYQFDLASRLFGRGINRILRSLRLREITIFDEFVHKFFSEHESRTKLDGQMTKLAKQRGADGVICGHFHIPKFRQIEQIIYANCGDWVNHGSAVVETHMGNLQMMHFGAAAYVKPSNYQAISEFVMPTAEI